MNIKIYFISVLIACTCFSCKKVSTSQPKQSEPDYIKGQVAVKFVNSVTRDQADQFIRSLNLTPIDLSDLDNKDTPHWGLVGVPIGKEKVWVDSLKTFPQVEKAELNGIIHAFQPLESGGRK